MTDYIDVRFTYYKSKIYDIETANLNIDLIAEVIEYALVDEVQYLLRDFAGFVLLEDGNRIIL